VQHDPGGHLVVPVQLVNGLEPVLADQQLE